MKLGRVLNEDLDFLLEVSDLHLRYCDHVRANPAEVGGLDLAVIVPFESDLLDTVSVTLQMFFVMRIVGPFCELNFIYDVFPIFAGFARGMRVNSISYICISRAE